MQSSPVTCDHGVIHGCNCFTGFRPEKDGIDRCWKRQRAIKEAKRILGVQKVYVIGSLRNPMVPHVANTLRGAFDFTVEVFDDWYSAGERADDSWKEYELARGHTYEQATQGYAAKHVFEFDKKHLDSSDYVLLVLPAGKSGHLELGYCAGKGKRTAILLDDVDRWDVMYQFAGLVTDSLDKVVEDIKNGR